jgi:Spx/MgsR family transcriptional regulator
MHPILYGIKNCDSVRKAVRFLDANGVDYTFIDFREEAATRATIERWIDKGATLQALFNTRSATWRKLKPTLPDLDEQGKIEAMARENLLIKRPVLELNDSVEVGFDPARYTALFSP